MAATHRSGFTLIEVIIAILVLTVGALALAGSSAVTTRRLSENGRRAAAAGIGRNRAEQSQAQSCASMSTGSDQWLSVQSQWTVSAGTWSADIRQKVTYPTRAGIHVDDFLTAAPC